MQNLKIKTRGEQGRIHAMWEKIISLENLFAAWQAFRRGKSKRLDVAEFEIALEDNVFQLHEDLQNGSYRHGPYVSFFVRDPVLRHIHKASVRDRLLHQAVARVIEPIIEKNFIYDSWSCRKNKGTHKAVERLQCLAGKLSQNNSHTLWALKLDARKFFQSIDHEILLRLLSRKIQCEKTLQLLEEIINSFRPGLPLGNLTSQLFANVYMNELDQFVKHTLKVRGYIRYSDDFILLQADRNLLIHYMKLIKTFFSDALKMTIHPDKIILKTYQSGIDFLGYVCFSYFRILRTKTKQRMFHKIERKNFASYAGLLHHCRGFGLRRALAARLKKTA